MGVFPLLFLSFIVVSSTPVATEPAVRLVGGKHESEGRLEVFHDGEWGTVCDNRFRYQSADVVCRELGYEQAQSIRSNSYYGRGTGNVWMDRVKCSGTEASLVQCPHNGWGNVNSRCNSHRDDVGVKCRLKQVAKPYSFPLRLSCPDHNENGSCSECPSGSKLQPAPADCFVQPAVEGIVEALYKGVWRPVSGTSWDVRDARVACGELGYPLALATPPLSELWPNYDGSSPHSDCSGSDETLCNVVEDSEKDFRMTLQHSYLKRVECIGSESRILDCYFPEFGPQAVNFNVATVRCGYRPHQSCQNGTEKYRLRAGHRASEGRAEVRIDGEWGTICDRGWDFADASVFCRSLGYGSAKSVLHGAFYGRGTGKIHLDALSCSGSEDSLADCRRSEGSDEVMKHCGHQFDASVVCNTPMLDENCQEKHVKLQDYQYDYYGTFLHVNMLSTWAPVCYTEHEGMWAFATVACREMGKFPYKLYAGNISESNRLSHSYVGAMHCSGEENSLSECDRKNFRLLPFRCFVGEMVLECVDGLPDLVPDLHAFQNSLAYYVDRVHMYNLDCAKEEHCLSSSAYDEDDYNVRHLLRFESLTRNYGKQDFVPILSRHEWIWHSCHRHFHSFEAFVHYDLLDSVTEEKVAEGHKASFCLEDSACERGSYPRFRCSTGAQGISVNCGDSYGRHLDCQWIDITGVPLGRYILRQHVNPNRLSPESDYKNNEASCVINISASFYGRDYLTLDVEYCYLSDH